MREDSTIWSHRWCFIIVVSKTFTVILTNGNHCNVLLLVTQHVTVIFITIQKSERKQPYSQFPPAISLSLYVCVTWRRPGELTQEEQRVSWKLMLKSSKHQGRYYDVSDVSPESGCKRSRVLSFKRCKRSEWVKKIGCLYSRIWEVLATIIWLFICECGTDLQ